MRPDGLVGFRVVVAETDLMIHAERDLSAAARDEVVRLRGELESYIAAHPRFAESFVPVEVDETAPVLAREMARAATRARVGPMASVAGAFAEAVGRALQRASGQVIVENGGDLWLAGDVDRTLAVWSGDAGVGAFGIRLAAAAMPCGVATSSATVGPSISFGSASAATVVAEAGAVADAVASAVGNRVHSVNDIEDALAVGASVDGVRGVLVVAGGHVGAWGDLEIVPIADGLL